MDKSPRRHMEADTWLNHNRQLLSNPETPLVFPAFNMIKKSDYAVIEHHVQTKLQDPNHGLWMNLGFAILKGARGDVMGAMLDSVKNNYTTSKRVAERNHIKKFIHHRCHFYKPAGALENKEKQIVLSMAELHANGSLTEYLWTKYFPTEEFTSDNNITRTSQIWEKFMTHMTWSGGKCDIIFMEPGSGKVLTHKLDGIVRETLRQVIEKQIQDHDTFLNNCANLIAETIQQRTSGSEYAKDHFEKGDRFFEEDDLEDSVFVNADLHPEALRMGLLEPNHTPIGLAKSTSLFVCAAPGAGKTQSYILPNLLNNPGSALVIDFKGEIYNNSSAWREDHYGPVYKFAPGSHTGDTAIYNPLDIIPPYRMIAPVECQNIASTMINDEKGNDPVWPLSAQKLVSVLLTSMCLSTADEHPDLDIISRAVFSKGRSLSTLNYLLSVCSIIPNQDDDQSSSGENIMGIVKSLSAFGKKHSLPDLSNSANQLYGMIKTDKMLESILLSARAGFGIFSSNPALMKAIGDEEGHRKSDWRPEDLRTQPGTSIYISISAQQMKDFAPLIKLIIKQHITQLEYLAEFKPPQQGELPVTFLFDEFARLNSRGAPFDEAIHITEQGRGALMRAVYIVQGLGQLIEVFGRERVQSIVSSCEASIFLTPSNLELQWIKEVLGTKHNIFTGEKEETEFLHHLRGRKYRDKAIVIPNGEYLMILEKEMAYKHPVFSQRMNYQRPDNKETAA